MEEKTLVQRKLFPKILNIASGKIEPLDLPDNRLLINVDTMFQGGLGISQVEEVVEKWPSKEIGKRATVRCFSDIFQFLETISFKFEHVALYRFLEHVSFTQVDYFIYLLSTVTVKGATVDVIVPDYNLLAKMLIEDNPWDKNFHAKNILLTTELLNEPSCPHASIWTEERAKYFWHLEGRFQVKNIRTPFSFDGRNIYLRFTAERI